MDTTTQSTTNFQNEVSANESLLGRDGTQSNDVVRFTHEGDKPEANYTSDFIPRQLLDVVADPVSHEISDYVRRPFLVRTGFLGTSGPGNNIATIPTAAIRASDAFRKLEGFFAFSATFCFKLVTNAQPTQSGVVLMSFVPDGEKLNPFNSYSTHPGAMLSRYSCLPSVVHNIGAVSESELRVAYRGIRPMLVVNDYGNGLEFGNLKMTTMARVRGQTDAERVPFSLYMWLEDLKTYGTAPTNPVTTEAVYQGHVSKEVGKMKKTARAAPAVKEAAMKTGGPVSTIADKVGDIADVLTAIPGVADVAGPVSWAARGVAQVASMLGYSKPNSIEPSMALTNNPFKDFAHGNGVVANQVKLTLNDDQEVSIRPLGPTEDDEMNINYLLKRPNFWFKDYGDTVWNVSDPLDKMLFEIGIGPLQFRSTIETVDAEKAIYSQETTLSYLARFFRFWRGTINLTLVMAATKFHSGRLRVVFVPDHFDDGLSKDVIDWSQRQHMYTHIIDFRDANTITIQVPFVSVVPWLRTSDTVGTLRIYVETPLIAHPSAAQTIDILPFVSATDFQFAGPYIDDTIRNMNGYALPAADSTDPAGVHEETPATATYEGFTDTVSNDVPAKSDITNSLKVLDHVSALSQSIGDPVVSLRTLAKRMTFNTQIKAQKTNSIAIQCNYLQPGYIHPTNGTAGDFVDMICSMFLFRSGGMRFALHGPFDEKTKYKYALDSQYLLDTTLKSATPGSAAIIGLDTYRYRYSPAYVEVPYCDKLSGALIIECPFYSRFPFLRNGRDQYATLTPSNQRYASIVSDEISDMNSIIFTPNTSDGIYTLYRSGADDFNCGFFIGPPIVKEYISY